MTTTSMTTVTSTTSSSSSSSSSSLITTTTATSNDSSTMKTPATLSGGDLVSRLLAATPPYLYNVPLTSHNFFFSEMLRSFVQPKSESNISTIVAATAPISTAISTNTLGRRRKRSWRDTRDRPLELTTKDKNLNNHNSHTLALPLSHHHHHHHHHHQNQYPNHPHHHHHHHHQQQQQQHQQHHHHHHHQAHHQPMNQQEKYYHRDLMENRFKLTDTLDGITKNHESINFETKSNVFGDDDVLKPIDENRTDFIKNNRHFFDDSSRYFSSSEQMSQNTIKKINDEKYKIEHQVTYITEQRNKIDFTGKNFLPEFVSTTKSENIQQTPVKKFDLTTNNNNNNNSNNNINQNTDDINDDDDNNNNRNNNNNIINNNINNDEDDNNRNNTNINDNDNLDNNDNNNNNGRSCNNTGGSSEGIVNSNNNNNNNNSLPLRANFITTPLWYQPYPIPQSYPGIDPLHFFIDLRVSGHIWDRKLSERQSPFKSKHCSAFNVPQTKDYNNRPLNLTRDEATTSRMMKENYRGTHFIMKHLTRTYKDIENNMKIEAKSEEDENQSDLRSSSELSIKEYACEPSSSNQGQSEEENVNRKDLRALIGLELVVDCVKEPKDESITRQSPKLSE